MSFDNQSTQKEFEDLLENHNREIFIYLWRMLPNKEDAEDCLQDTFIKAYKAFPRLKNHDNLRAWLYKIATNTAITRLKNHNRQQKRTTALYDEIATTGGSVSTQVENSILVKEIKTAVEKLPIKQRSAFIFSKYQHLKYPEIAEALNISEESARANVYQALKKLRAEFKIRINNYG